jgi:phenylacetate-CoA ligase
MFIHPSQVDLVLSRNPLISRIQVQVTQQDHQDEMTLLIELPDEGIEKETFANKLKEDIREIMRLRGEVRFVASGTIPAEAKRIEDKRVWE